MDVGHSVWFFLSLGLENGVWFVALQDLTPVCPDVCCPLSLSLSLFFFLSLSLSLSLFCVRYFRRRRFSLCLSHRCWGNPNPSWGWDSPFVSSSWTRTPSLTRTPCSTTTPKPLARLFFFFFLALGCGRRSLFSGGWFWLVGPLSLSLSLSFLRIVLACKYEIERGGGLQDGAPIHNCDYVFGGLSTERRPEHSVQSRLCSPTSSRSPLKQGPEEEVGEQTVLSCKCCSAGSADRTVTQTFSRSAPFRSRKCCPFFFHFVFLCLVTLVQCLLPFFCRSSLLKVVV